jgi:two-component system, sensor histidine kinase LadS
MRSVCLQLRYAVILWLVLAGLVHATASGQPLALVLPQLPKITAPLPLLALGNVPASTTIAQIAAGTAGKLTPFDHDAMHAVSWQQPLWLHFRVRADKPTSATAWTLALDKPFIDRVEFYARSPEGGWQMQAAGDWIAHTQWPQRSLNPQFYLPALSVGEHDFYVRVLNLIPAHFAVQLLPSDVAQQNMQHTFTIAALMLGFMALIWLLSMVLALVYRHAAYGWYALYVAINVVLFASYLGIGSYALWRSATWWPEESITLCLMAAMLVQLLFCRAMFLSRRASPGLYKMVPAVVLLGCLALVAYAVYNIIIVQTLLFLLVMLTSVALMVASALDALRQRSAVAWLWLLAYTPFLLVIALSVVDGFGWYALPWLAYHSPLYALLFEMPLLLIALHLHARALHTRQVRNTTLANIDPATGYVAPHLFTATLETLWQQAQDQLQDMVVVYVWVQPDAPASTADGSDDAGDTQRTVRALRTVVREQDTIAQIKPQLFAIFMPSMALNDALTQRLARLVAVGRMVDVNAPQAHALRFRVVAASKASFTGTWQQLDASLRKKLFDANGWSRKSIRYVRLRGPNESEPESDLVGLSQMWDLARAESARLDAVKS